ncbi:MAG: hypothetical protein U1F05_09990 [Burkholderiales bacterium]
MTRISRLLATLTGAALLCLAHFASVAHAGITNITVDITVTTTPTPTVQPTVSGAFSYGISCTAPSGPAYLWSQPAASGTITAATPIHGQLGASASNSLANMPTMPNTCTVTQLTRPNAPAGYLWVGSPAPVVLTNVLFAGNPAPYLAAFANVLSLPVATGVASPLGAGTVSCTPLTGVNGTSVCQATPTSGYRFSGFTTSGCGAASQSNPYTTSALAADCTVTATFVALTPTSVPTLDGWALLALVVMTFGIAAVCTRRRRA